MCRIIFGNSGIESDRFSNDEMQPSSAKSTSSEAEARSSANRINSGEKAVSSQERFCVAASESTAPNAQREFFRWRTVESKGKASKLERKRSSGNNRREYWPLRPYLSS